VVGPRGVWTRGCRPEGVLSSHNKNPPCVFDGEAVPLSDVADTRAYVALIRTWVAADNSPGLVEDASSGRFGSTG
jgi:hypothetical protein